MLQPGRDTVPVLSCSALTVLNHNYYSSYLKFLMHQHEIGYSMIEQQQMPRYAYLLTLLKYLPKYLVVGYLRARSTREGS